MRIVVHHIDMPLLAAALLLVALKPTEIYFVRHGETIANATGAYNSRTIDTFSALGEKQVAFFNNQIKNRRFDAIVVSPSPRALRTIAPYLRANNLKATVWPELYECCDAHSSRGQASLQKESNTGAPSKFRLISLDNFNW